MNNDQFKGHLKEVEGTVKEITGEIANNKTLEEKGRYQHVIGKVQANLGDIEAKIKKSD